MFDWSTTGQRLDSQAGMIVFMVVLVVTVGLWFLFDCQHRRSDRDEDSEDRD